MQTASGGERGGAPRSLKERLALLECGVRPVASPKARAGARVSAADGKAQHRRTRVGTSFWMGLGCGGALGGAMLLLAILTHPHETQARLRQIQAAVDAMAKPSPSVTRPVEAYAPAGASTQAAFEMSIHRGDGGTAPLALRILGVDGRDGVQVLLRDVPATARLSRGERRDQGTWALGLAELENLHLTLADGTPDAFDMTIEVASARGTRMAKAVAHVRVSEPHSVAQVSAPPVRPVAAGVDDVRPPAALAARSSAPGSSTVAKPFRTEVTALAHADGPPPAQRAAPRPPPEGMSSLGGPVGGPAAASAQPQESRTVWWKLPQPAWTPFADAPGSH